MDRKSTTRLLLFVVVTVSTSLVCHGELKQSFTTDDFRNVTITYKKIGCFKDEKQPLRALPKYLEDLRRLGPADIIASCARLSWTRGYQGFGVQFYGECWSGDDALRQYDKYNTSSACDRGIGGHWSNSIYFFTNTTPLITAGPRPWKGTSGTVVSLRCQVKSPFAVQVTWYKNAGDHDALHTGATYNIDAIDTVQGYYWCKVTTPYGVEVHSDKALVVLQDYFTSIVKFKIKLSSRPRRSLQLCQPCKNIAQYLNEQNSGLFTLGPCRTWSGISQDEVECTIYRKRNNQYMSDYYDNVRTSLLQAARRGRLSSIQWRSIIVSDTEYCVQETTGKASFQGVFKWPSLKPGKSVSVECPYGPRDRNVTRTCTGDFIRGVVWKDPDVKHCGFNSKKTEEFNSLSKVQINAVNAKQVAKNLTKLFKSYKVNDLTESDAEIAADVVQKIIEHKEKLSETADLVLAVVDTIMNMNKTTLANSATTASKMTKALETIAEKIPMEKGKTSRVLNTTNLVLQANEITTNSFQGMTFGISKDGFISTDPEQTKTSVKLPPSLLANTAKESIRVGFIYYSNNRFFQQMVHDDNEQEQSNTSTPSTPSNQVLSSSVYDTNTSNLHEPVVLRFPKPVGKKAYSINSSCVFWDEYERQWSNAGCQLCEKNDHDGAVECCCNHLTSFAVLFSPGPPLPSTEAYTKHAFALSIITYVGCTISLIGVLLTFLTYLLFRHLRKTNQQPILMNLCIAIALLLIVFVAGVNSTSNRLGCQIVAVLLHYLTLVTVLWMGIEAYNLYLQIVKVMAIYHRKFMLKAAVVGWGVPLIIVLATLIAATVEYNQSKDSNKSFNYGSDYACVLSNNLYRIIAWFAPILGILLFNLLTFILVIYKLNSTGAMIAVDSRHQQRRRCWTALAIMCLLGITWLFGALAISDARIVFEYLFCIFNSLQGFFIFFFHCVRIKEVRSQWTFFVSGLGFSHRESEYSHQRSKGFDESHHSSEAFVKVRNWIDKGSDQLQRKETVLTNISTKQDNGGEHADDRHGNNNSYSS